MTRAALIELIGKSRLFSEAEIAQLLQISSSLPEEPQEFLDHLIKRGLLTRFQAEQLMLGRHKGFFLGKYKILYPLGRGGMGAVFLGEHLTMKHRVAIKVLPAKFAQDRAALERFKREAMAVAALRHPNIVKAHDIDQIGNTHFIVMEYVEGITLQALVKEKGPLSIDRAANYIYQAALGLQHVHEAGLVHRDIKPGNLMLERPSSVGSPEIIKILDLGLARFNDPHQDQLTRVHDQGAILGTADYLSPEQGLDSSAVDIRSDIYSLGGTFYYLLTSRAPFEDANTTQKLLAHQMREPEPISRLRPETPPQIIQTITTMMAKAPQNRFQTPAEVASALASFAVNSSSASAVSWLAVTPTGNFDVSAKTSMDVMGSRVAQTMPPETSLTARIDDNLEEIFQSEPAPKFNSRWLIGIASGVGVFVIGLVVLLLMFSQRQASPPTVVDVGKQLLLPPEPQPNQRLGVAQPIQQPTIKPLRELPAHPGQVTALCYSPDGTKLITAANDTLLRVWNTQTGQLLRTYHGHQGTPIAGVAMLPDGQSAISGAVDDRVLHLWDIRTGKLLKRSTESPFGIGRLAITLDGQTLATTANQQGPTIVWDAPTLQPKAELNEIHRGRVRWVTFSNDSKYLVTACIDRSVAIWQLDDLRQPQRQLSPLVDLRLQSISIAPDSSFLITSLYLKTARSRISRLEVYNSQFAFSGQPTLLPVGRFQLLQQQEPITEIYPVPGNPYTVLGSTTGLELVDLVQTRSIATYRPKLSQPTDTWQLAVSPNGRELAVTFGDEIVRIFKLCETVR